MLTSDLLRIKVKDGNIEPRSIDVDRKRNKENAEALVSLYRTHVDKTRGELEESVRDLIGDGTGYLIQRGLAKLLSDRSTFEVLSPVDPRELRQKVFELMAQNHPVALVPDLHYQVDRTQILAQAGEALGLSAEQAEASFYADLQDAYMFTAFEDIDATALLHRYNLALVQALLFRANQLRIELRNATAQRLRQVMRYLKFFRLIAWIRPLDDRSYRIEVDGPMSLFRFSQKYGIQMATFLPALLLCEDWSLEAEIQWEDKQPPLLFSLDSNTTLKSHYPDKGVYVTEEEKYFRKRWSSFNLPWSLQPKANILRLGSQDILVSDYALTHEDGREVLLYMVGFWQRHSLIRQLDLLETHSASLPQPLIVAAPARLRASQDDLEDLSTRLYFYKDVIHPKRVAALADAISEAA